MEEIIKYINEKYKIDISKDVELLKVNLPYSGEEEGCKNLKYCGGLYTQCKKETGKEYCKVCQVEINKEGSKYGTTYDREKFELGKYIAKTGKQELDYGKYMKSHNYSKEMVIEAAKMRKQELPKNIFEKKKESVNKRNVEVSDTSSECSEPVEKKEEKKEEKQEKQEEKQEKKEENKEEKKEEKKGRGRPKKEEKTIEVKEEEEEKEIHDDSEDEIEVKRFSHKGKSYLKDINNNKVYTEDGEEVGVYDEDLDEIV
jgi:hypothetical protein